MKLEDRQELFEDIQERDERHDLVDSRIKHRISLLIRNIRNRQELSQSTLAERMGGRGKHQTTVARLEKIQYGGYTVNSLLEICKALDVALFIDIIPFSEFLEETENLTVSGLTAAEFTDEDEQARLGEWLTGSESEDEQVGDKTAQHVMAMQAARMRQTVHESKVGVTGLGRVPLRAQGNTHSVVEWRVQI